MRALRAHDAAPRRAAVQRQQRPRADAAGARPGAGGARPAEPPADARRGHARSIWLGQSVRGCRVVARAILNNDPATDDPREDDFVVSRALAEAEAARVVGAAATSTGSNDDELVRRIAAGEFSTTSPLVELFKPLRKTLATLGGPGRGAALALARLSRAKLREMPEATGDIREIVGQPVFLPLYNLFLIYGKVFRLSFGPKSFVVVSDPAFTKDILLTNAKSYSKGLLAEILEFVMGQGLIPADGEHWRIRRRAILPSLHKRYVAVMLDMFGDCALHGAAKLELAASAGQSVEMENFFSRLALDIIGKAVFNYNFDSLTHDDPVIAAVYTALREAEYRSIAIFPYWNFPPARWIVPRQRRVTAALEVINGTLDKLIADCKALVEEADEEFVEEYLNGGDPSILRFLIASGDKVSSKQLRDDLMTMLIAGHETTAAVLTWTFYLLARHPDVAAAVRAEVDAVCGDRAPTMEDTRALAYTTRVINESMRLYPQPPVLLRRAIEDVKIGPYDVPAGADIFISTWNLHRSPLLWDRPHDFDPGRFGPLTAPIPNEFTENYRYLPFGGGLRKCIGDQFALLESISAMAVIMRRFEFDLDPAGPEVGMTTGATIHTTAGLLLRLRKRNVAPSQGTGGAAAPVADGDAHKSSGGGGCPMGFGKQPSADSGAQVAR